MPSLPPRSRPKQLGYDELFSYDHIGTVDPFVPLVVAAEAAAGLRVGPLVLNNELHHPALLARTAATVDALTGGRLVLGLGTGYMQSEHDAIGMPLRPPGPRVRRFDESLAVLRSLLDDGAATFDGEFHHVAVDDLGIRPVQAHVPFLIGGHGRRVVGLAARFADIFQFTGLTHGEGGVPSAGGLRRSPIVEHVHRWLVEAAGDRLDDIERSALVQVTHVGRDADEQRRRARRPASTCDRQRSTRRPFVLAGSVEQVVDKVERLRAESASATSWSARPKASHRRGRARRTLRRSCVGAGHRRCGGRRARGRSQLAATRRCNAVVVRRCMAEPGFTWCCTRPSSSSTVWCQGMCEWPNTTTSAVGNQRSQPCRHARSRGHCRAPSATWHPPSCTTNCVGQIEAVVVVAQHRVHRRVSRPSASSTDVSTMSPACRIDIGARPTNAAGARSVARPDRRRGACRPPPARCEPTGGARHSAQALQRRRAPRGDRR